MAALDKIFRAAMAVFIGILYLNGTLSGKVVLMLYCIEAVFLSAALIGSSLYGFDPFSENPKAA